MTKRGRAVTAGVAALVISLSACTHSIPGAAGIPGVTGADVKAPPGTLGEQIGAWTPTTYAGLATYDACAILSLAELEKAGFETDPGFEYQDQHFTANGTEPPGGHYGNLDGASACHAFMKDLSHAFLNIYQMPLQDAHDRDVAVRYAQKSQIKDETRNGVQVITSNGQGANVTLLSFFSTDYWATLYLTFGDPVSLKKSPDEITNYMTEQVSAKLAAGPAAAGPATHKYSAPYDFAPPACAIFQAADFTNTFNESELGRVAEVYNFGERPLTASAETPEYRGLVFGYVKSSCLRVDQGLVTNDLHRKQMSVEIQSFQDPRGAKYANDYDCSGDPKYKQPYGQPTKAESDRGPIGDGYACWMSIGYDIPMFGFKVGRHVVKIAFFNGETITAFRQRGDEQMVFPIVERLTQHK